MFLSLYNIKIGPKNISFFQLDDESYLITDQYLFGSNWYNYEDSYNYYNINVNNILPYKKVIMNMLLDIVMIKGFLKNLEKNGIGLLSY